MKFKECPNCSRPIKGGLLNLNPINEFHTPYINRIMGTDIAAHCDGCATTAYSQAKDQERRLKPVPAASIGDLTTRG